MTIPRFKTAAALAAAAGVTLYAWYAEHNERKAKALETQRTAVFATWYDKIYAEGPLPLKIKTKTSTLELAKEIFEHMKPGGKLGIRYVDTTDGVDGLPPIPPKTPLELFSTKSGDCSDIVRGYVWLFRQYSKDKAFVVERYKNAEGESTAYVHAIVGILTSEQSEDADKYEYKLFQKDANVRAEILEKANVEDNPKWCLILVDPSEGVFGAQDADVRFLNKKEDVASFNFERSLACVNNERRSDESLNTGMLLDDKSPYGYAVKGAIYLKQMRDEEGIKALEKATKLKRDWPKPYRWMSNYYVRKRDWRKAKKYATIHDRLMNRRR